MRGQGHYPPVGSFKKEEGKKKKDKLSTTLVDQANNLCASLPMAYDHCVMRPVHWVIFPFFRYTFGGTSFVSLPHYLVCSLPMFAKRVVYPFGPHHPVPLLPFEGGDALLSFFFTPAVGSAHRWDVLSCVTA